jgi:hypothetical protein
MSGSPWLTAALWIGSVGLFVALLFFVSSATSRSRMGRGAPSMQHFLVLQSVYEPGKKYVYEQKQVQLDESDDEGSGPPGGADEEPPRS